MAVELRTTTMRGATTSRKEPTAHWRIRRGREARRGRPYPDVDYLRLQRRQEHFAYPASFGRTQAERLAGACYQATALRSHLRLERLMKNQFVTGQIWYRLAVEHARLLLQSCACSDSGLYELLRNRDPRANPKALLPLSREHRGLACLALASFGQEPWRVTRDDQDRLYLFVWLRPPSPDAPARLDLSRMYGAWLCLLCCPEITGFQINRAGRLCTLGYRLKCLRPTADPCQGLVPSGPPPPRPAPPQPTGDEDPQPAPHHRPPLDEREEYLQACVEHFKGLGDN